jgi:hypothetical protein
MFGHHRGRGGWFEEMRDRKASHRRAPELQRSIALASISSASDTIRADTILYARAGRD